MQNTIDESLILYNDEELKQRLLCPICLGLVRRPIL
jgi:hypothetical protein